MKSLNNQKNDRIELNNTDEEKRIKHYEQLWNNGNATKEALQHEDVRSLDDIDLTKLD